MLSILIGYCESRRLFTSQGKNAEADRLYIRYFSIGENSLGPDHRNIAPMLSTRAAAFQI